MRINPKLPLKFKCTHCNRLYLYQLKHSVMAYPACPYCHKQGQILGSASPLDCIRHPLRFFKTYLN